MTTEHYFLLTEPFFDSGYNGEPWSISKKPQLDVFYFNYDAFPMDLPVLQLAPAIEKTLLNLQSQYPNLIFLDDGSIESKMMETYLSSKRSIVFDSSFRPKKDFIEKCQNQFGLYDIEMIWALAFAQQLGQPLIIPRWSVPIENSHYLRTQHVSIAEPYLVHIENEKYHRLAVAQFEMKIALNWNLLKSTKILLKSFYHDSRMLNWIESPIGPDNYSITREILYQELQRRCPTVDVPLHRAKWPLNEDDFKKNLSVFPPQQAAFPLHVFSRQVLRSHFSVNSLAEKLYGP